VSVHGAGRLGATGVDEYAIASLRFGSGVVASLSTGLSVRQDNGLKVYGSAGQIEMPNPWLANRGTPDNGRIIVRDAPDAAPREITVPADATCFTLEADAFGDAVREGQPAPQPPAPCLDDTLGNMRTLDVWRASIGLRYPVDTSAPA
jgi:predicted dehydrogenase